MRLAFLEALENRRLLSGYSLHTLGTFPQNVSDHTAGTVVRDSAGDVFGLSVISGGSGSAGIYEVPVGSTTPVTLATLTAQIAIGPGVSGLVIDAGGNLFGAASRLGNTAGDGIVFELPKGAGSISTLAQFNAATTGSFPTGNIVTDTSGNLYGVAEDGTGAESGGTIWEYNISTQTLTALATFPNVSVAGNPFSPNANGITLDGKGDIFGTTSGPSEGAYYGTVWELPSGSISIQTLASFNQTNGSYPDAPLVIDSSGNVFGDTTYGGQYDNGNTPAGLGTVFEIAAGSGTITDIASFDGTDGAHPTSGLVADSAGDLFGAAGDGDVKTAVFSDGCGDVFEIANGSNVITPLIDFAGSNGAGPSNPLTLDGNGDLFSTCTSGGANVGGTVFELTPGGSTGGSGTLSAAATAVTPANAVAGQSAKTTVTTTLSNTGTGVLSETVSAQLFLSSDGTVDSNSISVTPAAPRKIKFKPGAHAHFASHVTKIAVTTPPGTYQWIEQITEPDGNMIDAAASSTIAIAAPQISLTGSFVKFATTAEVGKKFADVIAVSNALGNVPAAGMLPIVVETSADGNPSDASALTTIDKKINIAAGKSSKISLGLTVPTAGSYFLVIELDPQKTLANDDSTNNMFSSSMPITVG